MSQGATVCVCVCARIVVVFDGVVVVVVVVVLVVVVVVAAVVVVVVVGALDEVAAGDTIIVQDERPESVTFDSMTEEELLAGIQGLVPPEKSDDY